jgi:pimeloyl-ACP methyl ester carboxylesterase
MERRAPVRAAAGYRRFHVDLPGFGASPPAPDIDGSDAMVDFVLELIDELVGAEPLLIVGESWGAYLAQGVVARRPDQVLGVALLIPVVIATHADRDVCLALASSPRNGTSSTAWAMRTARRT